MSAKAKKQPERHIYPTAKQQIALDCPCDVVIFGGSRGGGKCLSINDLCITPFGEKRMGDLKVGDAICDTEGSIQRVTGVYFNGIKDMYRVKFIDGASVSCTEDHLWNVKTTCHKSKKRKYAQPGENPQDYDWKVLPFREMKAWLDKKEAAPEGASIKHQNLLIPLCKPVKFTKTYKVDMRPIDPYVLGLIIGDGCLSAKQPFVTFTSADKELPEAIRQYGYVVTPNGKDRIDYFIKSKQLIDDLKKLGIYGNLSADHFIPQSYKLASVEERISLIQGLFDADGTVDYRGHVSFCTISKKLAEDVQWIIRSLGGKATITESPAGYRKENGEYVDCQLSYDVYVNTNINKKLFRLQRKIDRCRDEFNGGASERHRRIVGYEYIGKEECVCITVTHPNSLYLTNDFIVTHNSACSYMKIMQHAQLYADHARVLFLRKALKELEQNIDEAKSWFDGIAVWKEQKKRFEFKNGAICEFDYLDDGDKINSYQGHAYTLVVYDELGNFPSIKSFDLMRGNLRSAFGVPCQIFATCNPGGPLHNIIKQRYIDCSPAMTPVADGWDDDGNPVTWKVYIPSTLYENPHLLENDPSYVQRLKQIGSPEMVRAWLLGDWSIVSGGAFDKLWDKDIHVVRPFRIPDNWRVVEVYDDGTAKPYAMLWFAISDGSDYYLPNGEVRHTIRGDTFVIAELYGWNGNPNEGTDESVSSKAAKIKAKERALGYHISERIADSAIFSSRTHSIADDFEDNGVSFVPCNKAPGSRINSLNLFRNRLIGSLEREEEPGIFWFSTCVHCIRTIPVLSRDKKNPDDIDSKEEDHCADCVLYFCLSEDNSPVVTGAVNNVS